MVEKQITEIIFYTGWEKVKLFNIASLGISLGTVGLINIFAQPATAEDYVGNRGIQFKQDTTIEFEFIASHGAYQSTFGVIDLESCSTTPEKAIIFDSCQKTPLLSEVKPSDNYESVYRRSTYKDDLNESIDFVGTPGNAVPEPMAEFTFKAGKQYVFYLESEFDNKFAGIVYSTDPINVRGYRQALFNEENRATGQLASRRNTDPITADINQFESLINGGILLRFDDTGSKLVTDNQQDGDFDDFVVGVGGYEQCIYEQSESY